MLIAIPSDSPGGLEAPISEHFGHCPAFTLVEVEEGEIRDVTVLANAGHEQGGCMAPVMFLKQNNVDVLVAGGMGQRPLSGFQQVGIAVHFKEDATLVGDAVDLFIRGECRAFGEAQTCGGGGGGCGSHHQEPVEREPIEGVADVRDGRVITVDYELKDAEGRLIESSSSSGPMRYLHGAGAILPGLEKGLAGLEQGASTVIEVPSAEGFGERDERRVIEVARGQLPADIQVGAMVTGEGPQGQRIPFTVIEIGEDAVRLDGNHLLAGKDLVFEVKVVGVESATPEELEHGHVH
jgi:FKBP-type peptidyl-prolyl cis-trans isomerase 2/predicted Fe-Mo cluster-binding NifX family protein